MTNVNKGNKPQIKAGMHTAPKLTLAQIELMIAHVIRLPEIFNIAALRLKPELFSSKEELGFKILWQGALKIKPSAGADFFDKPEQMSMRMWDFAHSALETDQGKLLPQPLRADLIGPNNNIIERIFRRTQFDPTLAHGHLKLFLRDRMIQSPLKKVIEGAGAQMITDLPELLKELNTANSSLASIDEDPVESGAPMGWLPEKIGKFPTNIEFIDKFLRGGHAPKEVYGVLGAFASGKTSLAVQLVSKGALWQQTNATKLNEEDPSQVHYPKECYLFHYEATTDEVRLRLWSSICSIDHEIIEEFEPDNLTSIAKGFHSLRPYEKKMYEKNDKDSPVVLGEKERLENWLPLLRRNLWIVDMSGSTSNPTRGTGYVHEIRNIIEADLQRKKQATGRDHEVGVVVVDYVGAACRRHMAMNDVANSDTRFFIKDFGWIAREEIAIPLKCPVWLFHQLSGEANKRTHVVQQHFTDAAESKGFAENLTFCFALGTKDDETNTLLLTCSKARRAKIGKPPTLVMEGEFFRLAESKYYEYNTKTHRVEPIQMFSEISGTDNHMNGDMSANTYKTTFTSEADSAGDVS